MTSASSNPDDELAALFADDVAALDRALNDTAFSSTALPADLGAEVLRAALAVRPHGSTFGPPPSTPLDAFRDTVADLGVLLASLTPDEWHLDALPEYGRVRDLIAHLAGVEEHLGAGLAGTADGELAAPTQHIADTRYAIEELAATAVDDTAARWRNAADRVIQLAAASSPQRPVMVNAVPTDVDGMLVLRTFELWTHLEDVCAATKRYLPGLDAPRFALMSSRLVEILPTAVVVTHGGHAQGTVRFVFTGPGGGTYDRAFGPDESASEPVAVVITDVAGICRAAANRMPRNRMTVQIEGDSVLAERVLASVGAFAND
jgi:uncharacterized protein (TIGR03083 family)